MGAGMVTPRTEFVECAACAAKPGSPELCASCLHNRTAISELTKATSTGELLLRTKEYRRNWVAEEAKRITLENQVAELKRKLGERVTLHDKDGKALYHLTNKFKQALALLIKVQWVEEQRKSAEYVFCPCCGNINHHTHGCELGDFIKYNCKHTMEEKHFGKVCSQCGFTEWSDD